MFPTSVVQQTHIYGCTDPRQTLTIDGSGLLKTHHPTTTTTVRTTTFPQGQCHLLTQVRIGKGDPLPVGDVD